MTRSVSLHLGVSAAAASGTRRHWAGTERRNTQSLEKPGGQAGDETADAQTTRSSPSSLPWRCLFLQPNTLFFSKVFPHSAAAPRPLVSSRTLSASGSVGSSFYSVFPNPLPRATLCSPRAPISCQKCRHVFEVYFSTKRRPPFLPLFSLFCFLPLST